MAREAVTDNSLQNILTELEAQRKVVIGQKIKSYILIGAGVCAAAGFFIGNLIIAGAVSAGALLIAGFIFMSKAGQKFNDYRHEFKQRVIAEILKTVDRSLEIRYDAGLPERDFIYSELFNQQPDRYDSQDYIFGSAGQTSFSFSEVHAEYKTVTRTKHGTQEHWHEIFKGIVFCADFNKNFKGITILRPKDMGSAIGAWISDHVPLFSSSDRHIVKLESPDFDKLFITSSTDQVEARYILTPGMMERLCELNSQCRHTISVSFIESYVYIAFPLIKNYFEPPVFKSLLDRKSIDEDIAVIRFMYGIIEELDLNTRIWGKQ